MAEGTRLRDLSDHIVNLEEKMQKLTGDYQGRVKELTHQINEIKEVEQKHYEFLQSEAIKRHETMLRDSASRHEELLKLLAHQNTQFNPVNPSCNLPTLHREQNHQAGSVMKPLDLKEGKGKGKGLLPRPKMEDTEDSCRGNGWNSKGSSQTHIPFPKFDFPIFCGDDPRAWVESCEQYFEIFQIAPHQWMNIATMHLMGRAKTWKQSFLVNRQGVTWEEFAEAICRRFTQVGERYLIREFTNLKQLGTVERYQEKFEELRTQLLGYNPYLTEEHFISCYINGLREELIPFMDIAHPETLEAAYEQAKLHEWALALMNRKMSGNIRTLPSQYPSS